MVLVNRYYVFGRFLIRRLFALHFLFSLSIKSLLYFLKIMCCLDRKYSRKMCVVDIRLPLYTFSLLYLIKGLIYFCFLNTFLISNYSCFERFLKIRSLALHSLLYITIRLIFFLFRHRF